jgi:Fur family peroxide stress response transcriptional regulator
LAETCRRKALKVTHQRTEVFREVAGSDEHPDAETVYQRVRNHVPAISRDTVYRTLATLEGVGLIRRIEVLGGPARYDANVDRHHHFVCRVCGRVKDFHSEALNDLPIPKSVRAFGRIEAAQVQVRGVCASCASRRAKGRRRSPA